MNDEEVLLHLFKLSHGEMTGSCSAETILDDDDRFTTVACMKDGHITWTATREELMFDHIARGINETQS